jgi:chemotaxis protein MotB
MEPPQDEVKPGAPEWVVTFGDMMSLLLTFFVLLLSFSSVEAEKFKVVAGYMRQAFGLQTERSYTGVPMGTTILSTDARQTTSPADELDLVQKLRRELERQSMTGRGSVRVTERGVSFRLEGELLFGLGQAELRDDALPILNRIADLAARRAEQVEVEGHTDDLPISSARFPSNWELSTSRAGAAARYLISRGVPASRIRAVGYAETRPLVPNTSKENRSQNRRVEFLFARDPQGDEPPLTVPADTQAPPGA